MRIRRSALALASTVAVSVGLLGAAFATVAHAGCDTPARLFTGPDGVVHLTGGCLTAEDLVIPGRPVGPTVRQPQPQPAVRP